MSLPPFAFVTSSALVAAVAMVADTAGRNHAENELHARPGAGYLLEAEDQGVMILDEAPGGAARTL